MVAKDPSMEKEKENKKKKNKKSKGAMAKLSGPMKPPSSAPKPNPFEIIRSRRKFTILGARRPGEHRNGGLARSVAVDKRKKTLLKEYEESAKSSKFMDNRIGENDGSLPEFHKVIMRLQRERQLKLKKSRKFNLSDEEEDEILMTGKGSFLQRDDFEEEMPLDVEEGEDAFLKTRDEENSRDHVTLHGEHDPLNTRFPEIGENVNKTKKQLMQEIILKSKYYKAQKAKAKEEDELLMEKLDEDFAFLAQSESLHSLTQPNKLNALKALLNKNITRQSSKEAPPAVGGGEPTEKPDAYDKLLKEMALDRRARPSDRTKTPEEVAQEERERLEVLEEQRKKRMLATDEYSDEDSDPAEGHNPTANKYRAPSGDDLGDSFSVGEKRSRGWIDEIYDKKEAYGNDFGTSSESDEGDHEGADVDDSDSDASSDEMEKVTSTKDWDQSDDDNDSPYDMGMDIEVDALAETKGGISDLQEAILGSPTSLRSYQVNASQKPSLSKEDTLPFVIEAPNNFSELCTLLDNRSTAEVLEAINRIRACNSIKLAAENRKKMQVFYGLLLQYFAVSANQKPLNLEKLNALVKPLMEMSVETPFFAAICARQRLIHMRSLLVEDIKIPEKSGWPSVKSLLLLRLWSMTFPCSDFRHVVMTPAILLISEYLIRCRVLSGRDIAIGSFLCSMMLSITKQSQKFCPEALIFLQTLLFSVLKEPSSKLQIQYAHLSELRPVKSLFCISEKVSDVHPINFLTMVNMEPDSPFFVSLVFRVGILVSIVETLRGFVGVYERLSSFSEIFLPISTLLHEVMEISILPTILKNNIEDVIQLIKKKTDDHQRLRKPLQLRKVKPTPIKLLTPKFEENFVKGRDYDPDRERAERKKLLKRVKREAKGAARELGKDNQFIFGIKEKHRLLEEAERSERHGKAMAFLQEQEHAFKSGQLGKGRKRK